MALTRNQGRNLRCGNTIWRCFINRDLTVDIQPIMFKGKKVVQCDRSPKFEPKLKPGQDFISYRDSWYLSDAIGYGIITCSFATYRQALRFKQEFEAGRHPEQLERCEDRWCDDDLYSGWMRQYNDDY